VVPIQAQGSKPPVFLIHGLGGYVSCFAKLSQRLGADQPFYGLQARGLDGVQEPLRRVEDMAAAYITEIRAVQPEGPYYLGGFSVGGAVALEIAQQLHAQGQEVRLLVMVDCAPRTLVSRRRRWMPRSISHFFQELPFWVSTLRSLNTQEKSSSASHAWEFLVWSARTKLRHLLSSRSLSGDTSILDDEAAADLPEHHQRLREILFQAGWEYSPRRYQGRITLLRSTRFLFTYSFDRHLGWDDIAAGGVAVEMVPGDHESILTEPRVAELADKFSSHLESARAGSGRAGGAPPTAPPVPASHGGTTPPQRPANANQTPHKARS
jgi:thioesterase domain-containing protein